MIYSILRWFYFVLLSLLEFLFRYIYRIKIFLFSFTSSQKKIQSQLETPHLHALSQRYDSLTDLNQIHFKRLDEDLPKPELKNLEILAQPSLWMNSLAQEARTLYKMKFGRILFMHGTFVGHDPISFDAAIKHFIPNLRPNLYNSFQLLVKSQCNALVGDNGNFLPQYAQLFAGAADWGNYVDNFHWSSANHHAARLEAALDLANHLARQSSPTSRQKGVLLVGHSHAGQAFALLTRLMAEVQKTEAPLLLECAKNSYLSKKLDYEAILSLHKMILQFVTLGTPPRYRWFLNDNILLCSVINHRGSLPKAGTLSGFLNTRDGDYVQQWGISGSDFLAVSHKERKLNSALNQILDEGQNVATWKKNSKFRKRVPDQGKTLLVDFGDASATLVPNCVLTVFGHGSYTRISNMLPLIRLISQNIEI